MQLIGSLYNTQRLYPAGCQLTLDPHGMRERLVAPAELAFGPRHLKIPC